MKNIIIIGTGKAALLHYNSYQKLKEVGNIYFCDIKTSGFYITNQKIYNSINECIEENHLDTNNLIVDICTPKSEFFSILDVCLKNKIYDILVEKPFVIDDKTLKKYKDLNIVMVENYLFSKVTKKISEFINQKNLKIKLIFSNFSKNRINDSLNGRGYKKDVTLNYEIEIPHQIYLTQYFLNNATGIDNYITCSRDMKIGDIHLKNHGYGLIISKCKDIDIIYESNLTSLIVQKKIVICLDKNYAIEGNYAIYTPDLKLLKAANITVYHNGKKIKYEELAIDDNFTYFIEQAYNYFNNNGDNPNIVSIESFSRLMKLYCNNLINRKKEE